MADTSRGWTSSTVTPLYLRAAQSRPTSTVNVPSGGVSGPILGGGGRVSSYRFANPTPAPVASATVNTPSDVTNAATNAAVGVGGDKPELAALKVYGLQDFATNIEGLKDQTLGSRAYASPASVRPVDVPISASVYQNPNVPEFLQGQIAQLNSEQLLKRSAQQEFVDRLFKEAQGGNYLAYEALRGVGVQPGAKVSFGAPIIDPAVQTAQVGQIKANTKQTQAQTQAVAAPQLLQFQKQQLEEQKARLGPAPFGGYEGSQQQAIDKQLLQLRLQSQPNSATTQIAVSAARPNVLKQSVFSSPYNPALPTF